MGRGGAGGEDRGLKHRLALEKPPFLWHDPEKIVPEEGGGGAGIYPLSNSPLPSTRPHPSHGPRRSVPWMGAGGGVGAGGDITSLSPGWAIRQAGLQGPL